MLSIGQNQAGKAVRRRRLSLLMTLAEVSNLTGLPVAELLAIEEDENTPSPNVLEQILNALTPGYSEPSAVPGLFTTTPR